MKKILLISLLICFTLTSHSQELVKFHLQSNGAFVSDEGKDFVIVEFPNKNQQELYNLVKSNVMTLYNKPSEVMTELEFSKITIHALSGIIYNTMKMFIGFVEYRARYTLDFHFKDGRIKIDAPSINTQLNVRSSGTPIAETFPGLIEDWFDKKGNVKSKKTDEVSKIEIEFNSEINYLLGLLKKEKEKGTSEEDW